MSVKRRPSVWIACLLIGGAAGAGIGWSVSRTERLAHPHMFEESRGNTRCNFKYCKATPAGQVRWSRTFHRTDGQGSPSPGGTLDLHFCAEHLGREPGAFYYRLPATTAVPLWVSVGLIAGAIVGAIASRRSAAGPA